MLQRSGFLLALAVLLPIVSTQEGENVKVCHQKPLDLVYVVDGSRSVRPWNFKTVQDAIKDMVDTFTNIGPYGTRIGLIQYSSTVETEFRLDEHYTKEDVIEGVDKMKFLAGGTMTGEALKTLVLKTFTKAGGARMSPDVLKVAVIITDGRSQDRTVPIWHKRAKDAGITLFAIGVGRRIRDADLLLIASEPKSEHKFYVKNFDSLKAVPVMVNVQVCDVDECKYGNNSCEQICINTDESYKCGCEDGYQLQADGFSCVKFDPCSEAGCGYKCEPVASRGYRCVCPAGYKLARDEKSCVPTEVDPCAEADCAFRCERAPGQGYRCVCPEGQKLDRDEKSCIGTVLSIPNVVDLKLSEVTHTSMRVNWSLDAPEREHLIGYYKVTYSKADGSGEPPKTVEVAKDKTVVLKDLEPGTKYRVTVQGFGEDASTAEIGGEETTLFLGSTDATLYDASLTTLTGRWTPAGGDLLTGYHVQFAKEADFVEGGVFPSVEIGPGVHEKEFEGLDPGVRYKLIVTPVYGDQKIAGGKGEAVEPTLSLKPPVVRVHHTTLSTAQVEFTGIGAPAHAFFLLIKEEGKDETISDQILDGHVRSTVFTNLNPDTTYTVSVTGYAIEGGIASPDGQDSGKTKRIAPPTVEITATGLATADVIWFADKADSFEVSYFPVDEPDNVKTVKTEDISTKLTGLTPDTDYKVEVVAVVYDDDKPFKSDVGSDIERTKKLAAPPLMANSRTYTTATVKWGTIGMPADGFVLTYYNEKDPTQVEKLEFPGDVNKTKLTGLEPNSKYIVNIVGFVNEDGQKHESPSSEDDFTLGAIDPPDVIANYSTTTTLTSFWTDKVDPDNYVVTIEEVGKETGPPVTVGGDVVGKTFTALTPGTEYKVCDTIQVIDEGTMIESPTGCAYGMTKPEPPTNLVAYPTPFDIEVNFDLPRGCSDYFEARCIPDGTAPEDVPVKRIEKDETKFTCDNVKPGIGYKISIVTVCSSPHLNKTFKSDPADITTDVPLGAPRDFNLSTPTTHSIVATWSPPKFVEEVTEYVLDYESVEPPSKGQVRIPGSETTVTLMKLHPDTLYTGTITAIVGEVTSPPAVDTETTLEDTITIDVVDVSYNNITVSWPRSKVPHISTQTLTYSVQLEEGDMYGPPSIEMIVDVPTTETGYVIDNIKPATIYDIGIQYVYPLGTSDIAKTTGTTLAPPPGVPTFLNVTEVEFVGAWGYPRYGAEPIGYTVTYEPSLPGGMVVEQNIPSGKILDLGAKDLQPSTEYNVTVVANYKYGIVSESVHSSVKTKEPENEVMCSCSTYLKRQGDMERTINRLVGVIENLSTKIDNMETRTTSEILGIDGVFLNDEGRQLSNARRGDV